MGRQEDHKRQERRHRLRVNRKRDDKGIDRNIHGLAPEKLRARQQRRHSKHQHQTGGDGFQNIKRTATQKHPRIKQQQEGHQIGDRTQPDSFARSGQPVGIGDACPDKHRDADGWRDD